MTHTFQRGQRVEVFKAFYDSNLKKHVDDWHTGSVTNPNDRFGYVRVRMDSQHGYENGNGYHSDKVRPDTTGRTEYELRSYDLRYLRHNDIAALKLALENVNMRDDVLTDEVVQKLLLKLPRLP